MKATRLVRAETTGVRPVVGTDVTGRSAEVIRLRDVRFGRIGQRSVSGLAAEREPGSPWDELQRYFDRAGWPGMVLPVSSIIRKPR